MANYVQTGVHTSSYWQEVERTMAHVNEGTKPDAGAPLSPSGQPTKPNTLNTPEKA